MCPLCMTYSCVSHLSFADQPDTEWLYIDTSDARQGPFSGTDMFAWFQVRCRRRVPTGFCLRTVLTTPL